MVVELAPNAYPRALPLFGAMAYHLSIAAVLGGTMPGRVFADDASAPALALVSCPEGNYLAGAAAPGPAELGAARALLEQLRAYGPGVELFAAPEWEEQAAQLFPGRPYEQVPRRHYALSALAGSPHAPPPELTLLRLDAATLARPDLQGHHIQRWASGNWGSAAAFLERGFGFALLHGAEPVSWCLADSCVGARCEVGIHTHPAYRRRGLATTVVAAAVAHALAAGYAEVGWHCGEENRGSQGVAEKVGFSLTRRFRCLVWPPAEQG